MTKGCSHQQKAHQEPPCRDLLVSISENQLIQRGI